MSKPKPKHFHHYYKLSNGTSFRCSKPGCNTIINGGIEAISGRTAECPKCLQSYIVTHEHTRRKKLWCLKCGEDPNDPAPPPPIITKDKRCEASDPFLELLKEKNIG